jgi:hypothetical protein
VTETKTAAGFVAERIEESQRYIALLDGLQRRGTTDAMREGMYSGFSAQHYGMAYLMQILHTIAPEIADRAAVDLTDALDIGEAAGIDDMTAALAAGDPAAWNLDEVIGDREDLRDLYHSIRELYRFRLLYNAGLFNEWAAAGLYDVHKSRLHHDGEVPFGNPNLFKVTAQLSTGQISNHYVLKDWDLFRRRARPDHPEGPRCPRRREPPGHR